jgi:hypothetical protein
MSIDLDAFHLPAAFHGGGTRALAIVAERDGLRAHAVRLPAHRVTELCVALIEARERCRSLPTERVVDAIDAAARCLRDPDAAARHDVLRGLVAFTGLAPAMAAHVLDRVSEDWLAPSLHRLVTSELGGADAVDGFLLRNDGSRVRAVAPPLGLHIFAGNVPGVSVTSIIRALLVRSAVLGKPAAGEPILAAAFARLLADIDPVVGACVAVNYWQGGDAEVEAAALVHARIVVHYGSGDAIASLRERAPSGTTFVEHGPRISFAALDPSGLDDPDLAARDLARAVALFDQQGCVSPQVAYVVGTASTATDFAGRVAAELQTIAHTLPRGRLEPAEAVAIHQLRTRAEFRAISGEHVQLWAGDNLGYTVVCEPDPAFAGTCLNRTLLVKPVASITDLIELVRPFHHLLQTVGIAGFDPDRVADLAARLGDVGVSRITTLDAMPWPPPSWLHDGRGPLRELVHWVELDA